MVQHWMCVMRYQWSKDLNGQFIDRHKQEDVVTYCQDVFLPAWVKLEPTLCQWGGVDLEDLPHGPKMWGTIILNHYELTYYPNDQHKICWVHQGEHAVLYVKGDGVLLMTLF